MTIKTNPFLFLGIALIEAHYAARPGRTVKPPKKGQIAFSTWLALG